MSANGLGSWIADGHELPPPTIRTARSLADADYIRQLERRVVELAKQVDDLQLNRLPDPDVNFRGGMAELDRLAIPPRLLSATEFRLFCWLLPIGTWRSSGVLKDRVWGDGYDCRSMIVTISRMRTRLKPYGLTIQNLPKRGHVMERRP